MKHLIMYLFGTAVCVLLATSASSLVIRVPQDYPTIGLAVDAASSGDTILISPGEYPISSAIDFQGKSLDMIGIEPCTIKGTIGFQWAAIYCHSGDEAVIEHITFTFYLQPAVYCSNDSSVTLRNCSFFQNFGVAYNDQSTLYMIDCLIYNNSAYYGSHVSGLIGTHAGSSTIQNCEITNNLCSISQIKDISAQATYTGCNISNNNGPAIESESQSLDIRDCIISFNQGDGVAVYAFYPDCNRIENCDIFGNSGTGCLLSGNGVKIVSTRICDNIAPDYTDGGGFYLLGQGVELENCLIYGNRAWVGGGIYALQAGLTIQNCTIAANTSTSSSGAGVVLNHDTVCSLSDTIIWNNIPANLSAVEGSYVEEAVYSDIGQDSGVFPGTGNINADPLFVTGPEGDYHLSHTAAGQAFTSPCVDSGSDTAANICISLASTQWCLDQLTTRTDHELDAGIVDMGYHSLWIPPVPATGTGFVALLMMVLSLLLAHNLKR